MPLSTAFRQGSDIPKKYTCDGDNVSPPLAWSGAPESTRSFLLVCDDPDAPAEIFHHWAAFDIPPDWRGLKQGPVASAIPASRLRSNPAGKNFTVRWWRGRRADDEKTFRAALGVNRSFERRTDRQRMARSAHSAENDSGVACRRAVDRGLSSRACRNR